MPLSMAMVEWLRPLSMERGAWSRRADMGNLMTEKPTLGYG
jgi:hypothetical protein